MLTSTQCEHWSKLLKQYDTDDTLAVSHIELVLVLAHQ